MSAEKMWHVSRNKKQYGPFSTAQLQAIAAIGALVQNDLVRAVGGNTWLAAGQCEGVFQIRPSQASSDTSSATLPRATSDSSPQMPVFDAASSFRKASPARKKDSAQRRPQLLSNLMIASIAGLVCFAIGFISANSLKSGKKQQVATKEQANDAATTAGPDDGPARWLKRYQAFPVFHNGKLLTEMPKELQGQWVDVFMSGDDGQTYTRSKCKQHAEFLMFGKHFCFGRSDLTDPDDLSTFTNIWRLPDSDGKSAWAVEPTAGIRLVVHATEDDGKYVVRLFESEDEDNKLLRPTWRSLIDVKPHTEKAKRFAVNAAKQLAASGDAAERSRSSNSESDSARPSGPQAVVPARNGHTIAEFAGLRLGCSMREALAVYGNPHAQEVKPAMDHWTTKAISIEGNPKLTGASQTFLTFTQDDKLYEVRLNFTPGLLSGRSALGESPEATRAMFERSREQGQNLQLALSDMLKEKYGKPTLVKQTKQIKIGGRYQSIETYDQQFTAAENIVVTYSWPTVSAVHGDLQREAMLKNSESFQRQSDQRVNEGKRTVGGDF